MFTFLAWFIGNGWAVMSTAIVAGLCIGLMLRPSVRRCPVIVPEALPARCDDRAGDVTRLYRPTPRAVIAQTRAA